VRVLYHGQRQVGHATETCLSLSVFLDVDRNIRPEMLVCLQYTSAISQGEEGRHITNLGVCVRVCECVCVCVVCVGSCGHPRGGVVGGAVCLCVCICMCVVM